MTKYRIDLSGSIFEEFIKGDLLYVDKTLFIEHFLEEPSKVLLVTRPRRMGKSLNMNMLASYLDLKGDAAPLFAGLKIEGRPCFREHLNRYPVIYLDFRFLRAEDYKEALRDLLAGHVRKYLSEDKWTEEVRAFAKDRSNTSPRNLLHLTENLHEVYGEQAVILIDEYDHVLMDNVGRSEYQDIRNYITGVFETALKGNAHLYKALLTGVLRVSQESMFSKLNNIDVYDVFTPGAFDEDFGLTEEEVQSLTPAEVFPKVKDWYNNVHVGKHWLFYPYSVLSYLKKERFDNYWGQSGSINLLGRLMTPSRAVQIGEAAKELGASFVSEVDPRVSLEAFFGNRFDEYYYGVAIQAGYLTFESALEGETLPRKYRIRVPNKELLYVWRSYILSQVVNDSGNRLGKIFAGIGDLKKFGKALAEFISFKLSYFDLEADALEKTYHVFIFGMILTLGYECTSNMESGYGRYDLLVKAPEWTGAIEFKMAKEESGLQTAAQEGLDQIHEQKYLAGARKDRPAYAIGVGCFNKECVVIPEQVWKE